MSRFARFGLGVVLAFLAAGAEPAVAQPYGLDTRANLGAYLNMPTADMGQMGQPLPPLLLSQTGAFSNTPAMTPHAGLIPFRINSALWSDGAIKTRWIGLPYNSGSGSNPTIGFAPTGDWSFPDGTIFVKHFELVVNEQTMAKRRLETRILVRQQGGWIYGRSYRWRLDNLEADAVEEGSPNTEDITITQADGTTRQQTYLYPRPSQCQQCHTQATDGVLGPRTYQLNGDQLYAATGVTDNQIRTWNHLGMFNVAVDENAIAGYLKAVAITDTSATLEARVRSYVAGNCSNCHRPGATGIYDARFDTPIANQSIFGPSSGFPNELQRFNASGSRMIFRDSRTSAAGGMPPLAKNVVDDYWIETVTAMVNYPYDVMSVTAGGVPTQVRVTFDRAVDAASATVAANYQIDNGVAVMGAALGSDPRVVVLTTSPLSAITTYTFTVNNVTEAQAPKNPIWPNTQRTFQYTAGPAPASTLYVEFADYKVAESAGLVTIGVRRAGTTGAVGVSYATQDGTATAPSDYVAKSGTLAWTDGDNSTKTFTVQVKGDVGAEGNEVFMVVLSTPTGDAAIGTRTSANVTIVNSALDPAGDADNDGVPNSVEVSEGLSPYTKDNDVFVNPRLFAMQQYRDFLGREGDAGGIQFYVDQLNAGTSERATVIESFFNSPEFSGSVSPIARLYFATFLRIPDYGGLLFQVDAYRTGTPLDVIANNFTLSPEFQATYGSLDNPSYVSLLYQNILGRTASQGEIDFHVNRLTSGVTRGAVLVGFSESPEYQQLTAHDVYVTMMYVGMLRRAPEQSGFDFWVDYMDAGNPGLALILGFLNAPEYHNRFLP